MLELLDTRASFLFAVLVLTWVGLGLLLLMLFHLYQRVQRLEQAGGKTNAKASPYSRLAGRSLRTLASFPPLPNGAHLLLLLSSTCRSCRQLLDELPDLLDDRTSCLLAWADGAMLATDSLPTGVVALENGAEIAAALEIGITPFALLIDDAGKVTQGLPVENAATLRTLLGHSTRAADPARSDPVVPHYLLKEATL